MQFMNSFFSRADDEIAWLANFNEKLEKYQDALPCDQLLVYAIQADASRLLHTWNRPDGARPEMRGIGRPSWSSDSATELVGARNRITTFVQGLKQSGYCSPVLERELGI